MLFIALCALGAPASAQAAGGGDAADNGVLGTSALRSLAEANGHHANLINDSFRVPAPGGVLMIIEPADTFTPGEARAVVEWVTRGGVLVYAATSPERTLEAALGLSRSGDVPAESRGRPGTPLLAGVTSVQLTSALPLTSPTGTQVAYLRSLAGEVLGIYSPIGQGRVYALAGSGPLSNGDLANADNGVLAADLLAAAGASAEVSFDQFHHAGAGGEGSSMAWLGTPWGFAILLEVLVAFALLLAHARVFGPRVPIYPGADPSSAEFTSAVGAMMRRAGARRQTVARLLTATRSALAAQSGIRAGADPEQFEAALAQRSPALAEALRTASTRAAAVHDEGSMAEVAAELHRLAHPPLRPAPGNATPGRK
ncbi:MAG: hypothetical protein NVSMB17_12060 [Candidatus Dormibacteria bacterium]